MVGATADGVPPHHVAARFAAVSGHAWLLYGAVECAVATLQSFAGGSLFGEPTQTPASPDLSALLLVAYPLAGAAIGAGQGLLFAAALSPRWTDRATARATAGATIVGVFAAHAAISMPRTLPLFAILGGCIVALALIAGVLANRLRWSGLSVRTTAALAGASIAAAYLVAYEPRPALPSSSPSGTSSRRPNIVLVSMDTVRADHLPLYGYARDTTPQLRSWAAGATLYRNAFASSDFTLPSHASMFTGLYSSEHGADFDSEGRPHQLADDFETLAEILAKNGYRTLAVIANNAFLRPSFHLDQGFEHYDVRGARQPWAPVSQHYLIRHGARSLLRRFLAPRGPTWRFRTADEINASVFDLLERLDGRIQPLFLFVNYMDAHDPYVPPPPFDSLFPGKDPTFPWDESWYTLRREISGHEHELSPRQRDHLSSQYDGAIAYVDSRLSELLERLERAGLCENALLIITSDHGEAFGERAHLAHGNSVYQDEIGIPLLVKFPGQQEGGVIEAAVSHVDILPTVLVAAGIEVPGGLRGLDLAHLHSASPRAVISESRPSDYLMAIHRRFKRMQRAIIEGSLKYVRSSDGGRELYDLATDPFELHDLASARPGVVDRMDEALGRWIAELPERPPGQPVGQPVLERLRALGYAH